MPMMRCRALVLTTCFVGCAPAWATTQLEEIHLSADIHFRLPADGGALLVGNDDTIIVYNTALGEAEGFQLLGTLDASDIDAYHANDACGAALYSLDATIEIAGTAMRPADVFRETGQKILDATAEGIPDGVNIDALSRDPDSCQLVFSIDITTELNGQVYGPGDLIGWDSTDGFSLYTADAFGIDIDALHLLGNERMLMSVSSAVQFPDIFVHDDEVFEVKPDSPEPSRVLSFSARALDDSWIAADLDALWALRLEREELIFADRFESP